MKIRSIAARNLRSIPKKFSRAEFSGRNLIDDWQRFGIFPAAAAEFF
jgi:hypothetical protein